MINAILFVDDEQNILDSFKRTLRKRFTFDTALGPAEALNLVRTKGPYAVVVSDMKMPEMDGIELLTAIRELHPDTVRIMLTGHGDLEVSMAAVNEGQIFRFLTKPCPTETLIKALEAGLEQHRLVTAERELLRGTLRGSVNVLTEILSLVNPEAFGRGERAKRYIGRMARRMNAKNLWRLELGAMLSQIGGVMLTEEVLQKKFRGEQFTPEEAQVYDMHPSVGANFLTHIPRMAEVAEMIQYQNIRMDDPDITPPLGSRMLKIALDFDDLEHAGKERAEAISDLRNREGAYDPELLAVFEKVIFEEEGYIPKAVSLKELKEDMILAANLFTLEGHLLLSKGKQLTRAAMLRLQAFHKVYGVKEPIHVRAPITDG